MATQIKKEDEIRQSRIKGEILSSETEKAKDFPRKFAQKVKDEGILFSNLYNAR